MRDGRTNDVGIVSRIVHIDESRLLSSPVCYYSCLRENAYGRYVVYEVLIRNDKIVGQG